MEIAEIVILGEMRLFIKNMVCPRCIAAVESTLKNLGMNSIFVRLGEVLLEQPPSPGDLAELDKRLQSQGFELLGTPPSDNRPHGVFATRSPRRPNPVGLTIVELLSRDGTRLHVRGVDMLDGTPILDIKPYLSSIPAEKLRRGWLAEAEARRNK